MKTVEELVLNAMQKELNLKNITGRTVEMYINTMDPYELLQTISAAIEERLAYPSGVPQPCLSSDHRTAAEREAELLAYLNAHYRGR